MNPRDEYEYISAEEYCKRFNTEHAEVEDFLVDFILQSQMKPKVDRPQYKVVNGDLYIQVKKEK